MAVTASLRPAAEADLPVLAQVELLSFPAPNWPAETFLRYDCTIAEFDGQIVGFLVSRQIYVGDSGSLPEREILNLAVLPPFRRGGIATVLLRHELRHHAVFTLEVRASNAAARRLYESVGFVEISQRRDYYENPPETAIVMRLK